MYENFCLENLDELHDFYFFSLTEFISDHKTSLNKWLNTILMEAWPCPLKGRYLLHGFLVTWDFLIPFSYFSFLFFEVTHKEGALGCDLGQLLRTHGTWPSPVLVGWHLLLSFGAPTMIHFHGPHVPFFSMGCKTQCFHSATFTFSTGV